MNAGHDSAADDCTVGIDLGTTRSVIAHLDEFSRPRTIPNGEGELATPGAVLFEDGRVIVGKEALRALASAPEHVAQFAKREMGNSKFSMMFDGTSYPPEMIQSFGWHATMIGKFVVYDLPRGLSARTPIDVLFSYDRDGIIEVEAAEVVEVRVDAGARAVRPQLDQPVGHLRRGRQRRVAEADVGGAGCEPEQVGLHQK